MISLGNRNWPGKNALIQLISLISSFFSTIGYFLSIIVKSIWVIGHPHLQKAAISERQLKHSKHILNGHANSYDEWFQAAKIWDQYKRTDEWRKEPASSLYDVRLVQDLLKSIRSIDSIHDPQERLRVLRAALYRNIAGINNPKLFDQSPVGTKDLIEEFRNESVDQLRKLYEMPEDSEHYTLKKKFDFFFALRQTYGRSALLLSGGATLGLYHLGVLKALFHKGLLPRVISGSSVGAIMASICCAHPDSKLKELFDAKDWNLTAFGSSEKSVRRRFWRFLSRGYLLDVNVLQQCLRANLGDLTFREAFDISGRVLNVTVSGKYNSHLLNYITAPNVVVWSAAVASCAIPFVFEAVELMAKDHTGKLVPYHTNSKWTDGSVTSDLPMTRLAELFHVNQFIVSQVNPHIVPFLERRSRGGFSSMFHIFRYLFVSELRHRVSQLSDLGWFPLPLASLITQPYRGDVTIVPKLTFADYANLFSNPSFNVIQRFTFNGCNNTYPIIPMIESLCKIEVTIEQIYQKLKQKLYDLDKQKWELTAATLFQNSLFPGTSPTNTTGTTNVKRNKSFASFEHEESKSVVARMRSSMDDKFAGVRSPSPNGMIFKPISNGTTHPQQIPTQQQQSKNQFDQIQNNSSDNSSKSDEEVEELTSEEFTERKRTHHKHPQQESTFDVMDSPMEISPPFRNLDRETKNSL